MNTIILISFIIIISLLIFGWIFSMDIKDIIKSIIIIEIIFLLVAYSTIPEFSIKIRIVNETNKNQTLQDITQTLSQEEIKYYKTAMFFKQEQCMNHTVNYIIKIGEDISKTNIKNILY